MGLVAALLTLPLAPLRGVVALGDQVLGAAEEEFFDPARIRAELEDVARRRATGELTDDQAAAWEDALVERMMIGAERRREG